MKNQTGKYIKYAFGEIILVVIGILIALSINNWNEGKKDKAVIHRIFSEIQKDLLNDIQEAEFVYRWYEKYDTIAKKIIGGDYTLEDYKDPKQRSLFFIGKSLNPFIPSNASFLTLNDHKDKVPPEYDKVIKRLNMLYVEWVDFLEKNEAEFTRYVNNFNDHQYNNYNWAKDIDRLKYPDEAIDYFLNDPIYKNKIARYNKLAENVMAYLIQYKDKATLLYLILSQLDPDQSPLPEQIASTYNPIPDELIQEYVGSYDMEDNSLDYRLINVDGLLLFDWIDEGRAFYSDGAPLSYIAKDSLCFISDNSYFLTFQRDNEQKVSGMTLITSSDVDLFTRIEQDD